MAYCRHAVQCLPIKFNPPLQVAHGAKQVTAEIEISYDNDPPLGIRTVWQKVEYPIAWFDTQAPLFNTVNVVAHKEGRIRGKMT